MDNLNRSRLVHVIGSGSRRAALTLVAGGMAAVLGQTRPDGAARRRRKNKKCKKPPQPPENICAGKNWCIDRSLQTCGGKSGKCLVEATGGNICAEIIVQASDCAECEPPDCTDCVCILATGGGDRCGNGAMGLELICAKPV